MKKNKLFIDVIQICLIILMVFFSLSLTSSGKEASKKLTELDRLKEKSKDIVVIKYKLIHGNDTIYVNRELDSILNSTEYTQFLENNKNNINYLFY